MTDRALDEVHDPKDTIRMALSAVRTIRRADMGSVDLILAEIHLEDALKDLERHELREKA